MLKRGAAGRGGRRGATAEEHSHWDLMLMMGCTTAPSALVGTAAAVVMRGGAAKRVGGQSCRASLVP
jgi:hypothetical protein